MDELRRRFAIKVESAGESAFIRFKLQGGNGLSHGFAVEFKGAQYYQDGNLTKPFSWIALPLDLTWVENPAVASPYLVERPWGKDAFGLKLLATVHILETGLYSFLLGSEDTAELKIDGQKIIDDGVPHSFRLSQRSMVLERGTYPLEVAYSDSGQGARLVIDLHRMDEVSLTGSREKLFESLPLVSLFTAGFKGRYYQSTAWSGESKDVGQEIPLGESLDLVWSESAGPLQKPWPAFSLRLEGIIEIPRSGIYQFELGSDDGSLLYLDRALVLYNGGPHPYREKRRALFLNAGQTAFRLDYFDIMADAILKLKVSRPSTFPTERRVSR